ncbi:citrate lyase ligase C- domain protein [Treponema primitia ZAS-2]|uniref:Citrate lyase ligase C-domain protein n=1 Tax=Treponema primitia (strain ATCC BAA-887 / DSM 12427 / ZAS-2) TaxID=545694 RepID=F5YGN4_TREPZ|nr:adenylyltransferase/cytidyltransferase family protein [Treponema primitia]AEF83795.1 citrate lyase ligase C- domain protein [Treponema primitia ZAS-2]
MKITPKKIVKAFIPYGILKILDVKKSKSIRVNAEKLQHNFPPPNVQTDIAQKWLFFQIHELYAAGYTATQWCIDKGYKNVVLYTEKQYWPLIEPIALSFRMDKRIAMHACSRIPFISRYQDEVVFGWFVSGALNTIDLNNVDVIFIIKPFIDSAAEKYLEGTKMRIVQLPDLIQLLRAYFLFEKPLILFASLHPDVHLLTYRYPRFPQKNRTENEDNILSNRRAEKEFLDGLKKGIFITSTYDELSYTPSDVLEMLTTPTSYLDDNNLRIYNDKEGKYVNIKDGHRVTIGQPENPERTIYFSGPCDIFGHGSPDSGTIPSQLQALLNRHIPERHFIVQNYGGYIYGRHDDYLRQLFSLSVKPGDIVVSHAPPSEHYYWTDLSEILQRPHSYGEVFIDRLHFNENGNRAVTDALYKALEENNFFSEPKKIDAPPSSLFALPHLFGIPESALQQNTASSINIPSEYTAELEKYKKSLLEHKTRIGAVVMNCNPFTFGHRYLAEYAAQQVERLYIFAVEEDKSIFPFADRLELIKAGVKDLPNVTVLPSGKFIISSLTFKDYFNKSEMQDRVIDPSNDVTIFAEEIAPTLGINVRFAGEEPLDNVTRQYNDTMKRILPQHGIEFEVIPRKEVDGTPISASKVRKLLEEKNFVKISKLVPETTLKYLQEKCGK